MDALGVAARALGHLCGNLALQSVVHIRAGNLAQDRPLERILTGLFSGHADFGGLFDRVFPRLHTHVGQHLVAGNVKRPALALGLAAQIGVNRELRRDGANPGEPFQFVLTDARLDCGPFVRVQFSDLLNNLYFGGFGVVVCHCLNLRLFDFTDYSGVDLILCRPTYANTHIGGDWLHGYFVRFPVNGAE